jgi:MinD-like ATPase involved in chromosome partitioning or flagellar assembly
MSVFSVIGTKGGVGKSTVTMGLSIWISKLEPKRHVLLIDGDLHVRSAELKMFPQHDVTLADVFAGKKPWQEAVYTCQLADKEGNILYPNLAGVPAGGRFLAPMKGESALAYLEYARRVFNKMITALRDRYDTIIVDTPASVTYEHLILTAIADRILYVCEANDDSINSTLATARGLERFMEIKPAGVVLSKVQYNVDMKKWKGKAGKIAPVLGVVPADDLVDDAFRDNLPVAAAYPTSPASVAIKEISKKLAKLKTPSESEFPKRLDMAVKKVAEKVEAKKR